MNHLRLDLIKRNLCSTMGMACLAFGAVITPLKAQGLDDYAQRAQLAMKKNNWPEAYAELKKATDTFDGQALRSVGPRFGWFWYRRGICEIRIGKYEDAMKSFKKCNVDYANKKELNKPKENQSLNLYENIALLHWGHAAKAAKQWKVAIEKYEEFLRKRDKTRDKMQPGVFFINNAFCNFKLNNFKKGSDQLETAIKNKLTFPTPNKGIIQAFTAMVDSVIQEEKEPVLLDFLAKNRGHVKLSPVEAYEYAPIFMQLAGKAKEAGMMRSTFELYSLVPSTTSAIHDAKAGLSLLDQYEVSITDGTRAVSKKGLETDLENLRSAESKGTVNEIYAFLNTAIMHEEDGNVRGAFAVYQQLEHYFPKAKVFRDGALFPMRENNLYNLVRTSSSIGEVFTTEKYGSRFLKAFPDSKYVPDVRRMMLTSLFWNGEYATCIKVASRMIPELKNPSKEHDICLFVLGGSRYYNGEFIEAMPLLNGHVKTYPETEELRRMAALYFQASNHTKISEWEKAAALLDSFLKAYPDPKKNIYMPFALFDRAQTHFTLEELEPALTLCNRIEKEFPGAAVMELNYNLKGNILELLDRESDSEKYHKKALQLAETKENKDVAGESLYYLVRLIGKERGKDKKANPRMLEALPFYDKFWAEHNNESAFQAKMAVVGLPAMKKAGREKEGLERMQGVISNITKAGGNSTELEEVINSYTEAYLESHTPEQLKEHYYNFPLIDSKDFATLAFLRISVINTYEKVVDKANKEGDDSAKSAAQAQVQVLFEDLRGAFNTDDLSPYILVRVGDFLREKTTAPIQAKPYYEAALKHQGHEYKFHALFGMADILAQGSEKGLAAEYLQRVIDSPDAKGQKEKALARMVDILFNQGNYTRAIESANAYLSNPKYRKNSLLVRLTLARARDANGQSEDAMAVFAQVWATATGTIRYSAPAIHRWMELTWERNGEDKSGKSDRQHAYEGGWRYVDQTKHIAVKLKKDGPQEELDLWNKVKELVLQYEASAETKTMKEILEEKGK